MSHRNRDYIAELSHALFQDDNTGPGVSGGEFQPSIVHYNTPRNEGDFHSKIHDKAYAEAQTDSDLEVADYQYFNNQIANPDYKYKAAAIAVGAQGVLRTIARQVGYASHPNKEQQKSYETPNKKLRGANGPVHISPADKDMSEERPKRKSPATAEPPEPMQIERLAASTPSSTDGLGRQTEVTPLPRHIKPGLPEYYTTKIVTSIRITADINATAYPTALIDIQHLGLKDHITYQGFSNNSPRSDGMAISGVYRSFNDYMEQMYDYYVVEKSEYQLSFFLHANKNVYTGQDNILTSASAQTP